MCIPEAETVATSTSTGDILLYDVATGDVMGAFAPFPEAPGAPVSSLSVLPARYHGAPPQLLVVGGARSAGGGGSGRLLRVWTVEAGRAVCMGSVGLPENERDVLMALPVAVIRSDEGGGGTQGSDASPAVPPVASGSRSGTGGASHGSDAVDPAASWIGAARRVSGRTSLGGADADSAGELSSDRDGEAPTSRYREAPFRMDAGGGGLREEVEEAEVVDDSDDGDEDDDGDIVRADDSGSDYGVGDMDEPVAPAVGATAGRGNPRRVGAVVSGGSGGGGSATGATGGGSDSDGAGELTTFVTAKDKWGALEEATKERTSAPLPEAQG
ncbi:hypothetical protein MMPV_006236 [Pyropia vietnamensis]